ncbi:hypothetical protein SUGI_0545100 [Cryptomeria japonica]|nr:hypothetical protein SUGI_0545100 [Cryptomeria japonica]
MHELGIHHDPQVKLLLKILEEEFDVVLISHEEDNMDLNKEESICVNECKGEEEPFLSIEEISYLLEKEFERYVQKNGPIFFQIKQTNGLGHIQGVFDEVSDDSQENMSKEFIHGDEYNRGCVPGNSFSNLQYNKSPEEIEERFPRYEFFSNPFCEIDINTFYAHEDISAEDICEDIIPKDKEPNTSHEKGSKFDHSFSEMETIEENMELQVGDFLTPAIQSAIRSASVQIAIFSKTYAQSLWCLDELVWMLDSDPTSIKIIPIFYDIEPSELRYVEKGAYATVFEEHRRKGRVTDERVESWIKALEKVSAISGIAFRTETDDHGERLNEIVETVLGREKLHLCEHPVGLRQAAEHFEKQTLLRNLLRDKNLRIEDLRRGRAMLQDRLRGLTRVLIVFDDIDNTEQIDNLLCVKDVLGNGSLILVTSRDQTLFVSSKIEIYNVKLLVEKQAQELFCWYAFGNTKPVDDLKDMVEELVRMCGGFPLALKILAGQLHNERDPRKWKQQLESLRKQLPKDLLRGIVMDSYESLDIREKEAFLDVAHFSMREDRDLVERVFDR